jgi:CheY-like chemotaxis protein
MNMGAHEHSVALRDPRRSFATTVASALDDDAPVLPPSPLARVIADLGSEIAAGLTEALERLEEVRRNGRMDTTTLLELRETIHRARHTGMLGQQLARLAGGEIEQRTEQVDIGQLLRGAVDQRQVLIDDRGLELRMSLRPAEVIGDSALAFSLLQTLVDWSLDHAQGRIEFGLELQSWPVQARLSCRFAFRAADEGDTVNGEFDPHRRQPQALDTMAWHLVQQTALALGLPLQREDAHGRTLVQVDFPRTVREPIDGVNVIELDSRSQAIESDSRSLAGSHVLVVAARRDTRNQVREALRSMGLLIDFVASLDEAAEFCRGGLPHAVVYESAIGGDRWREWQAEMQLRQPGLGFVAIAEEGRQYEVIVRHGEQLTRVGREAVGRYLPAAISHALIRALAP